MKKTMIRLFLMICFLSIAGIAQASILLYDAAFNVNGTITGYRAGTLWGAGFDGSSFDTTTGLGEITWTTTAASSYQVGGYFDIEIDQIVNTFYNEYGEVYGGAPNPPKGNLSWEIDEPGYNTPPGDIYSNFLGGGLDNTNAVPAPAGQDQYDVSFAMTWNFSLVQNQRATIKWILTETDPMNGFYLAQVDPDSQKTVYLYSTLDIKNTVINPIPEPATLFLFGIGLLGLSGWGRKKIK